MITDPGKLVAMAVGFALADESWVHLGYPRRPRRGTIINHFRAHWKVELERKILLQLLTASLAFMVTTAKCPLKDLEDPLKKVLDMLPPGSLADSPTTIISAVQQYCNVWGDDRRNVFHANVGLSSIPDRRVAERLSQTSAVLFSKMQEAEVLYLIDLEMKE